MIGLGILLAALGWGDIVATGLSGVPDGRRRAAVGAGAAGLAAATGAAVADLTPLTALGVIALAVAGFGAWSWGRLGTHRVGAAAALAALGATIGAGIVLSGRWEGTDGGLVADWLSEIPFDFATAGPGSVVLALGTAVALLATGNGVVRMTLRAAGTEFERPSTVLRGGRVIGVLERLLVFGLAAGGQLAAAAIVASAKGILRFPELAKLPATPTLADASGDAPPVLGHADVVTEYFLLGSLTSWALALAPALLL